MAMGVEMLPFPIQITIRLLRIKQQKQINGLLSGSIRIS
jgi:hypothetical protein